MPTPAELAAAVAAAKQAQAAADLVTLRTLSDRLAADSWTLEDFIAAITALIPNLSNPDTAARVSNTASNIQQIIDNFNQLVQSVQNTAGIAP